MRSHSSLMLFSFFFNYLCLPISFWSLFFVFKFTNHFICNVNVLLIHLVHSPPDTFVFISTSSISNFKKSVMLSVLMYLFANSNICISCVCLNSFLSLLSIVFFCFFAYLMPAIMNFTLLSAGYSYVLINILELCSRMLNYFEVILSF